MSKFQQKILVTLSIDADNAKCADGEAKDVAELIRTIETSYGDYWMRDKWLKH